MKLKPDLWDKLSSYLFIEKKLKKNHSLISRFKILCNHFQDKDFTKDNFNFFLGEMQKKGYNSSYMDNFIKSAKHIARCFKIDGFEDYSYFDENKSQNVRTLSKEEIRKVAEYKIPYARDKEEINYRMKCLILTLGVVGSRISETLSLLSSDILINENNHYIHFRAETTKTNEERFCPIPKWLYELLMKLPYTDTVFAFKHSQGVLDDINRRTQAVLGIHIKTHWLRYSSVNNKIRDGVPLVWVAKYHGHKKVETTYKHYLLIALKEMADVLATYDSDFQAEQNHEMIVERIRGFLTKAIGQKYNPLFIGEAMREIEKLLIKYATI
jgi:integrase